MCLTDTDCRVATAAETIAKLEETIGFKPNKQEEDSDSDMGDSESEQSPPATAPPPLDRAQLPSQQQLMKEFEEENKEPPAPGTKVTYNFSICLQADAARCKHVPHKWGKSITLIQLRPEGMVVPFVQLRAPDPFPFPLAEGRVG